MCETTYLVEDLPVRRKKKNSSEDLMLTCVKSVVFTHVRMSSGKQKKIPTQKKKKKILSRKKKMVNNPEEQKENLPSVAVSETVGEENEPEVQPREAEKTRSGRQTLPPRWQNDYARH